MAVLCTLYVSVIVCSHPIYCGTRLNIHREGYRVKELTSYRGVQVTTGVACATEASPAVVPHNCGYSCYLLSA